MKAQLAIVGLPDVGKTTLANKLGPALGLPVLCTDVFMTLPWADQADAAMELVRPRCIIEGITVARMFRRGFNPDCVLYVLGGDAHLKAIASLVKRGLEEYSGRVVCLPWRPGLDTALALIGAGLDDA